MSQVRIMIIFVMDHNFIPDLVDQRQQRHSIAVKEEQRISFNLLMAGHYSHAVSVENWTATTVGLLLL